MARRRGAASSSRRSISSFSSSGDPSVQLWRQVESRPNGDNQKHAHRHTKRKKNGQKSRLWRKIKSFQIMVSPLYVRKQQEFQPISHWSVHTIKNVSHAKERELRDWLTLLRTGTERKRDRLGVRKRDVNAMLVSGRLAKVCLTVARVMFFFELVFYILFFPFFFFCFHPYILPSSASSGNRPTRHTHTHTQRLSCVVVFSVLLHTLVSVSLVYRVLDQHTKSSSKPLAFNWSWVFGCLAIRGGYPASSGGAV